MNSDLECRIRYPEEYPCRRVFQAIGDGGLKLGMVETSEC